MWDVVAQSSDGAEVRERWDTDAKGDVSTAIGERQAAANGGEFNVAQSDDAPVLVTGEWRLERAEQ